LVGGRGMKVLLEGLGVNEGNVFGYAHGFEEKKYKQGNPPFKKKKKKKKNYR